VTAGNNGNGVTKELKEAETMDTEKVIELAKYVMIA